jgi:hypothetical protein
MDMFWKKKQGWFGKQLDKNIKELADGDYSKAPWVFCVFSEEHTPSKLLASKALCDALDKLEFDVIIRIDEQMRQTTSMEWSIDWRKLKINNFLTSTMNTNERRAVIVFASFNPNGFIREQAVRLMAEYAGTLPYIIMRQNDWVVQVRQSAANAFNKRLNAPSAGEILAALPFAEKLKWSCRGSHGEYTRSFFNKLTSPEHREDLMEGLKSHNIRTRKICVQALLDSENPDFEQAFQRLKFEKDPFLRKVIYEKLRLMKQDMTEYSYVFLRDRYPSNRILALQYLYDSKKNDMMKFAKQMLLDRSSMVREFARKIVQEHTCNFEFSKFYLEHIESHTVAAIFGLGEIGKKGDAEIIDKYLNDSRISVVRASIVALMRLDNERIQTKIIEMLGDSRIGVVKTSQQMIVKYGVMDYKRIQEIFQSTHFEYSKIKCAAILFAAPKWQSLIYMLESLSCEMESVQKMALQSINEWLFKFNKSFVKVTIQQQETINHLIASYDEYLPASMKRELLFVIK